ncbi:MAG: hypothetical protein C4K47_03945 [Candidatus Thorarchaeota archaeon]|nr:MAG: hypothetical protein C4K47_03945 [Candidatus Thorarchaeota archaeon]
MNEDKEPSPEDHTLSDDAEVDWKHYVYQQEDQTAPVHLDAKDYLALFIASLETIFLPLVILAVMLLVLGFIFTHI